jgi:hypothetical protein
VRGREKGETEKRKNERTKGRETKEEAGLNEKTYVLFCIDDKINY